MDKNYSWVRGLETEAAVEKQLVKLQGVSLLGNRKRSGFMGRILGFLKSQRNDEVDAAHTDFIVQVRSDVNGGLVPVPLQAKSSVRAGKSFEKKCRRYFWGPIQVVVVEDGDDDATIFEKVLQAVINGYHCVRRLINENTWRKRTTQEMRQQWFRRRHSSKPEKWSPRTEMARMSFC